MNSFRLMPDRASSISKSVDALYYFELSVSLFFTLLIFVLIVIFALKYRRRSPEDRPKAVPTSMKLEVTWTVIPALILVVMFSWGARLYLQAYRVPPSAMEISVIGKQWMWKAQHPEGRREINELHVPAGRAVKLNLTSQDVIHDFALPSFRVRRDVLPGRYTTEWFIATQPGQYRLFCSQYCGANHAEMVGWVYVMEPAAYQAWLTNSGTNEPPAVAGARLFGQYACMTCHGVHAPTLANLYGSTVRLEDGRRLVADDDYIRESIVNPRAKIVAGYPPLMPTYKGQLSEEQIMDLIAYIKSLGNGVPGSGESNNANVPPGPPEGTYVTHTLLPNMGNTLPTSGPAAPGGMSLPRQVPDTGMNVTPTTQP